MPEPKKKLASPFDQKMNYRNCRKKRLHSQCVAANGDLPISASIIGETNFTLKDLVQTTFSFVTQSFKRRKAPTKINAGFWSFELTFVANLAKRSVGVEQTSLRLTSW